MGRGTRLLYVAATRAKRQLFLTYPRELMTPDRQQMRAAMSPFLREISPGVSTTPADRAGAISSPMISQYARYSCCRVNAEGGVGSGGL